MRRGQFLPWVSLVVLLALAGGCGGPAPGPTPTSTSTPSLHLRVAAAPSAQARLEHWIDLFQEEHPAITLEVLPSSAAQAQEALAQGQVALAYLDQPPAALYQGVLTATQVASEPIAVLVHPGSPLSDLSRAAISELLSGRVESWGSVGGEDRPVQVYLRPDTAGEVRALAEALAGRHLAPQAIICASAESLRQAVARDPGGVGLLPAGDASAQVSVLRVDGARPSEPGYPWQMPLFLVYGPHSPTQAHDFIRFVRGMERPQDAGVLLCLSGRGEQK
jgi:phosphate transport system substrate-binding protein